MAKSPMLRPNMPRSEIPVDVLLNILGYVDQESLAIMCRVSKIYCSCSQDVLYRDIWVETPRVIQILAQSTHLARKVRSFESSYNSPYLATALQNMTSLRILKFHIEIHMDLLDGCTFKLDSFKCTYLGNYGESFRNFLSSQPSLKYVTFPKHFPSNVPSSLEATCLPNLTRINATPPWIPYLIPGRPLNEVIAIGSTSDKHSIDLSFFALSTTPIQKLTIDYSLLFTTPVHLLASYFPSLTHLTLTDWDSDHNFFFENERVCGLPLY
jgi:hypothetical protein